MVLAGIHQRETIAKAVNKAAKKARQEGLEEGRQEYRRAVAAWYERQQAAQREGRPFDEPPPGYVNRDTGGNPSG